MVKKTTFAIAAAMLLLLISGCTFAANPPKSGLTAAKRDEMVRQSIDNSWQATGLPPSQRPAVGDVRLVDLDDWGTLIASCMTASGYPGYVGQGGGYSWQGSSPRTDDEVLALYVCSAQIQPKPDSLAALNPAQLDFLYDYYRESLIPCLELHGIHIRTVQTRTEFHARSGGWNPYVSNGGALLGGGSGVGAQCPAYPTGYSAGYAAQ